MWGSWLKPSAKKALEAAKRDEEYAEIDIASEPQETVDVLVDKCWNVWTAEPSRGLALLLDQADPVRVLRRILYKVHTENQSALTPKVAEALRTALLKVDFSEDVSMCHDIHEALDVLTEDMHLTVEDALGLVTWTTNDDFWMVMMRLVREVDPVLVPWTTSSDCSIEPLDAVFDTLQAEFVGMPSATVARVLYVLGALRAHLGNDRYAVSAELLEKIAEVPRDVFAGGWLGSPPGPTRMLSLSTTFLLPEGGDGSVTLPIATPTKTLKHRVLNEAAALLHLPVGDRKNNVDSFALHL